jgi:hypothetical protein
VNAGRDGVAQYLAERHADHWGGELQEGVNATGGARSSSASARSAGATGSTVLDSRLTSGPSSVLARVKITPRWRSWMGLVLALWALFLVAWLAPNQAWPVAVGLNLIVDALPVTDSPRPLNLWPVRPLVVDGGDSPGDDGSVIDCGASEAIGDQAPDEAAQPGGALASPHQPRQRGRRSGRVVRRIRRPGCAGPRAQRSVFCRGQTEWGSLPPPAELNESFLPPTWARR